MNEPVLTQLSLIGEELPDHDDRMEAYKRLGLDHRAAFSLECRAAKIMTVIRRSVVEVGWELLEARKEAQFGAWAPFLQRIGIEERTAQNYMLVARAFGNKPEIVSALPVTALYLLAAPSADPSVVEAIITEVGEGTQLRAQDVRQRLAAARSPDPPHVAAIDPVTTPGAIHPLIEALLTESDVASGSNEPRGSDELTHGQDGAADEAPFGTFPAGAVSTPPATPFEVLADVAVATDAVPDDDVDHPIRQSRPMGVSTALPPRLPLAASDPIAEQRELTALAALLHAASDLVQHRLATSVGDRSLDIVLPDARVQEAAVSLLTVPAVRAAATMLALHATTERQIQPTALDEVILG